MNHRCNNLPTGTTHRYLPRKLPTDTYLHQRLNCCNKLPTDSRLNSVTNYPQIYNKLHTDTTHRYLHRLPRDIYLHQRLNKLTSYPQRFTYIRDLIVKQATHRYLPRLPTDTTHRYLPRYNKLPTDTTHRYLPRFAHLRGTNPKTSPEQSAIFQLVQEINKTNVLTKFHDDKCSITRKTAPFPTGGYVFFIDQDHLPTHLRYIKIVTSRVKTAPPTGGHVFQRTRTTFKLNQHIIKADILTKFHENRAKNVTSRVLTYINKTNVLTKFHDDWAKIVTSRVFTRKTAPPTGGHVYQRTGTTFELNQDIIKTNILTNFKLDRDLIGTKLLTKFHENRTRNVASRVFTSKC
ncbi:hypothetical protein DPMN_151471 [Dreissena polymorpha]|uniref:Uncharacterized protein n=1 Tax=Dreissena polymorpha TaxID=45954 RepID=A0A9D4FL98_DREPO|nr:hypothetical protein DPMN_151471 [Dreissena polymorpha]